jgi:hypothetical protein
MAIKVESIELSTGGMRQHYCDMKVTGFFQLDLLQKLSSNMEERIPIFVDFKVRSTTYRLNGGTLTGIGWDCLATKRAYLCFTINRDGLRVVEGG